jgi:hypothetical protein
MTQPTPTPSPSPVPHSRRRPPASDVTLQRTVRRVEVDLTREVYAAVETLCGKKHISVVDGIGRALALWKFLEDEQAAGRIVAVVDPIDPSNEYREIRLRD